jgi:uncharacterized protein
MLPFFFGSNQRRLFGVYEPAASRGAAARAALLCPSWGTEYANAYRTMRLLAKRLCGSGFDTLRFDYFGSGDSGGETVEADLDGWKCDIETALRELNEMSGTSSVALVGMKLGATLAAEVASKLCSLTDPIVLWDPVISGSDYIRELLDGQGGGEGGSVKSDAPVALNSRTVRELGGLSVSRAFVEGLNSIDLSARQLRLPLRVLTILTEDRHSASSIGVSLKNSEVLRLKATSPWDAPEWDQGMPVDVIERIVTWLR